MVDTRRTKSNATTMGPSHGFVVETSMQPHGIGAANALRSSSSALQPPSAAGIAEQPPHDPGTSTSLQLPAPITGAALPRCLAIGAPQQPHHSTTGFAAQPHGYSDVVPVLEQIHSLPHLRSHLAYAPVYASNGALAHMPLSPMHNTLLDPRSQVDLNSRVDQLTQKVDDQNNLIGQLLRQINLNQGPNLGPSDEERRAHQHAGEQFERSQAGQTRANRQRRDRVRADEMQTAASRTLSRSGLRPRTNVLERLGPQSNTCSRGHHLTCPASTQTSSATASLSTMPASPWCRRDATSLPSESRSLRPRIDQLVDSTSGNQLLSFMDAYSGYNQRLVNKIFKKQIGRTMEVYVDDMLVKAPKRGDHLKNLTEAFSLLRQYRMKLNPSKCTFGVSSGRFLGYLVTQRGIEAHPRQIKAILEMKSPSTVKEIRSLTGRAAALNRFLSKSTDKCRPFFKALKKGQKDKWDEECEVAFQSLKTYLTSPPLLSKPVPGEDLFVYLAVSDSAISSALIREELGAQHPVFYTSKALLDAETCYPKLEKLILALVVSARKLRPYYQAHRVIVMIDFPLRSILHSPDASQRLMKWAIELSQYASSTGQRLL
ncbi:hypothetical protein L3X38_022824 [Prunus dulcis]|uniref:Transposable element protein n=1 Tax=Prunus dulcis TaxID=3755 RepID=A0AAD4Z4P4_PRUDU|nr:hypothetical protein L3X38_022824 [Prunus dulcis]